MLHLIMKNRETHPDPRQYPQWDRLLFSVSVGTDRTVPFLLDGTDLRKKLRLL